MTLFTPTDFPSRWAVAAGLILTALTCTLLSGCIADTPEDTDLPWASNKGWEGIAPLAPSMMDRYE